MDETIDQPASTPNRGRRLFWAMLATLVATGGLTVYVVWWQWQDASRACRQAVVNRDNGREMFTSIIDVMVSFADDPAGPRVVAFRSAFEVELDARLPQLHCVNNKPVPEEPTT